MKLSLLATAAIGAAIVAAAPASAVVIVINPITNQGNFVGSHTTPETSFSDVFTFLTSLPSGLAAAATVQITFNMNNTLTLTSLKLNNVTSTTFLSSPGPFGSTIVQGSVADALKTSPTFNTLTVAGNVVGTGGAYSGTVTLTPGTVPEPATWGLMVLGFGVVGAGLRASRRKVVFA